MLLMGIAMLSLLSCSDENTNESSQVIGNGDASLPVPALIQRMSVPSGGSLSATVNIDGDVYPMKVSTANSSMSFSGKIDTGQKRVTVELFYESSEVSRIRLVSYSRIHDITNSTRIQLTEADFVYDNTDGDFYTNVAEIEAGSDPYSDADEPSPAVADDNFEDNDTRATAYDVTPFENILLSSSNPMQLYYPIITEQDPDDFFKMTFSETTTIDFEVYIDPGLDFGFPSDVDANFDILVNEEIETYYHLVVRVYDLAPGDHFVWFYQADTAYTFGTYAFQWSKVQ